MAEDQNAAEEEVKKSSPLMKNIIFLGVALLIPAIIAWVLFAVVIKPKLAPEPEEAQQPVDELPAFPATMSEVDFERMEVSVQTDDPDLAAPLLLMEVTLSCADEATKATIELKQQYFKAVILEKHQGRTRTELNDPLVKNSILEQIKVESNRLLKRLNPEAELMVLKAMYTKYSIMDL